ncbi:hypothetical protein A2U01_0067721, partial [Trifolium medium]|nr:hypothetical protein [Trifolium medium]
MFLPTLSASIEGREEIPSSTRSSAAMFTNVATASMAVGGSPMTWSPQGNRRDSISMIL